MTTPTRCQRIQILRGQTVGVVVDYADKTMNTQTPMGNFEGFLLDDLKGTIRQNKVLYCNSKNVIIGNLWQTRDGNTGYGDGDTEMGDQECGEMGGETSEIFLHPKSRDILRGSMVAVPESAEEQDWIREFVSELGRVSPKGISCVKRHKHSKAAFYEQKTTSKYKRMSPGTKSVKRQNINS